MKIAVEAMGKWMIKAQKVIPTAQKNRTAAATCATFLSEQSQRLGFREQHCFELPTLLLFTEVDINRSPYVKV